MSADSVVPIDPFVGELKAVWGLLGAIRERAWRDAAGDCPDIALAVVRDLAREARVRLERARQRVEEPTLSESIPVGVLLCVIARRARGEDGLDPSVGLSVIAEVAAEALLALRRMTYPARSTRRA